MPLIIALIVFIIVFVHSNKYFSDNARKSAFSVGIIIFVIYIILGVVF